MRKNYFLSLFLLMTAFWHVQATNGNKSTNPETPLVLAGSNAPSGLNGSPVGGIGTRITLSWNDNSSDETEFEIAYGIQPAGSDKVEGYSTVRTGSSNSIPAASFTLQNLQPSTTYFIWVRAIKSGVAAAPVCAAQDLMPSNTPPAGMSASCWSNVVIRTTNPSIPESPTAAYAGPIAQRTVTLNWTDNSNNETEFEILRSINGSEFVTVVKLPGFAGTGLRTYVDNSVQPNTPYTYHIWAKNITGSSISPAISGFYTPHDPPVAPNSLGTFDVGFNSIGLYWRNGANNADDFVVETSTNNANFVQSGVTLNSNFTVNGLAEGTGYFLRVKARNNGGSSGYSNTIYVVTFKHVAPNAPNNLTAKTVSTSQIDLSWTLGAQDGMTNNRVAQEIYRSSVNSVDGYVRLAIIGDQSIYSDKTCSPKTKYWYMIIATNYYGQSPFTNVASATTLGPPFAPSNLVTSLANDALGNTIIKATWQDNSADEWGFALERSLDATFSNEIVKADLDSNTIAATSLPIEEGLTYYFRIKASNKYGDSKYSEISQVSTPITVAPNAPYNLKGAATAAEVTLKWGDDSNKETAFEIERSDDGKTYAKIGVTARNEVAYTDKTAKEKTKYYYRVRATNVKGNSDYTNVVAITTLAKASAFVTLVDADVFQVYPNPTADAVKVTVSDNMLNESATITITDRMNREISKIVLSPNQSEYRLDLSNYSEGTYTISLRTATQQITKRVYKY